MEPNVGGQNDDGVFCTLGHFAGYDIDLFRIGTPRYRGAAIFDADRQIKFFGSNFRYFRFNNGFDFVESQFIVIVVRVKSFVAWIRVFPLVDRNNRTTDEKKT